MERFEHLVDALSGIALEQCERGKLPNETISPTPILGLTESRKGQASCTKLTVKLPGLLQNLAKVRWHLF